MSSVVVFFSGIVVGALMTLGSVYDNYGLERFSEKDENGG